jgi:hypothetical protein
MGPDNTRTGMRRERPTAHCPLVTAHCFNAFIVKQLESLGVSNRLALGIAALVLIVIALLVIAVRTPTTAVTFDPTAIARADSAHPGARIFTADARDEGKWHYFSFARARLVAPADSWDIAFKRFHIIVNGAPAFSGGAGVLDLGRVAYDEVSSVPRTGYVGSVAGRDTASAPLVRWYAYGFTTHLLTTLDHVYAVRTADGSYVKMQVLSYYCPGPDPGCMTIRFSELR